jgi:hypothetical protein
MLEKLDSSATDEVLKGLQQVCRTAGNDTLRLSRVSRLNRRGTRSGGGIKKQGMSGGLRCGNGPISTSTKQLYIVVD